MTAADRLVRHIAQTDDRSRIVAVDKVDVADVLSTVAAQAQTIADLQATLAHMAAQPGACERCPIISDYQRQSRALRSAWAVHHAHMEARIRREGA